MQERLFQIVGAGGGADRVRGVVGDEVALADQQQPVAAAGLVHHVAGHEQRRAGRGQRVELLPQVVAQHRVLADGRLVEDEQLRAG